MKKLLLLLLISSTLQLYPFTLGGRWTIRSEDGEVRTSAEVPSTVKMALFRNKLIPDPYFASQNENSQWVEDKVWIYEKRFAFRREKGRRYFLKLGGLAPRGEVYLNGKLLGVVEGMFAQPIWEITDSLRDGENQLEIRIPPERERTRAIACQMSYGWDFAPRIIPLGVWRPVEIMSSGPVLLRNPFLKLEEMNGKEARVNLLIDYDSKLKGKGKLVLDMKGRNFKGGDLKIEREVELKEGQGRVDWDFRLPNPHLWYPAGYGEQNLYLVSLSLYQGNSLAHSLSFTWGARKLEWEVNPGSRELYPWIAKVNGVRVYCKGANWVPADSLFYLSPQRYERLIELAQLAGINMFRIWGGGIMEEDTLYELCDRYGIMLWQEFPLACADYPQLPREAFLQNARDSLLRLRNHPSLVLWCGGNEFDPDNQSNKPLIDTLADLCQTLDGTRPFHRASPYGGDSHDWSTWHGSAPYTDYRKFCIFRSESGLQSPPIKSDLEKFISPEGLFPPSEEWSYHLADAEKIGRYAQPYGSLNDLDEFIKKAQLVQAITYQFDLDSCLKSIWANSGCLIWQFNDPWPNISWSMVDWYGNPKPSFYWFKNASQPINLVVDYDKTRLRLGEQLNIRVYALNLTPKAEEGEAIFLIASGERVRKSLSRKHNFKPLQAEKLWDFSYQLPAGHNEGAIFLIARIVKEGKLVADKIYPIPTGIVSSLSQPLRVLTILSYPGREAEEWKEIGERLAPFGIQLDVAPSDALPRLDGYDCFIIGESEKIGERLGEERMREIEELVSKGKGLLLDGGWNAYGEGGLKGTLIEDISPLIMEENSLRENLSLGVVVREKGHPIVRGLSFEDIDIRGYNQEKEKPGARIILALANGAPLLVEGTYGEGRCLAYTSGLRGGWAGTLRLGENGDIFIARLLAYLGGREGETERIKQEVAGLDELKASQLKATGERRGNDVKLFVRNSSSHIAFFLKIEVEGLSSQPLFSDNYFSLLPGEGREVKFSLPSGKWKVRISDWQGATEELVLEAL